MSQAQGNYVKPRLLAMVLALCGVGLSLQGWTLALLGGSLYYLSAGLLLIAVAVLLFRGKPEGAWLYGAFLGVTYLWALFEVGLDPWQLMPRVGLFTVLGLWFLLPRVRRGLLQREPDVLLQLPATRPVVAALAILVVALFANNRGYEVNNPTAAGTGQVFDDNGQWQH